MRSSTTTHKSKQIRKGIFRMKKERMFGKFEIVHTSTSHTDTLNMIWKKEMKKERMSEFHTSTSHTDKENCCSRSRAWKNSKRHSVNTPHATHRFSSGQKNRSKKKQIITVSTTKHGEPSIHPKNTPMETILNSGQATGSYA